MRNLFIIGSKGIPANYGGFETFVDKLTEHKKSEDIKYHVACLGDNNNEFYYNNARCFNIKVRNLGPAKAIIYDILALRRVIEYIKNNKVENSIVYVLACRIGPFIGKYKRILKKMGIKLYINPDGHEWKRDKWNAAVKKYWKFSEKLMVKNADLLICDSINIEKYIKEEYKEYNPKTTFIAYGADLEPSKKEDWEKVEIWYKEKGVQKNNYYLVVGRFVPENNYELMLREFIKSKSKKDFVLITDIRGNKFIEKLKESTNFNKDNRIKFVGTVYDKGLLKAIRENAYGYFHGHEVGGTNPSLIEALATTNLNLLLDVGFNREVAEESALYFNKNSGNLAKLIEFADEINDEDIEKVGNLAKKRIYENYTWDIIVEKYEKLFLD